MYVDVCRVQRPVLRLVITRLSAALGVLSLDARVSHGFHRDALNRRVFLPQRCRRTGDRMPISSVPCPSGRPEPGCSSRVRLRRPTKGTCGCATATGTWVRCACSACIPNPQSRLVTACATRAFCASRRYRHRNTASEWNGRPALSRGGRARERVTPGPGFSRASSIRTENPKRKCLQLFQ